MAQYDTQDIALMAELKFRTKLAYDALKGDDHLAKPELVAALVVVQSIQELVVAVNQLRAEISIH
jgi:hypothetical protein